MFKKGMSRFDDDSSVSQSVVLMDELRSERKRGREKKMRNKMSKMSRMSDARSMMVNSKF